MKLSKIKKTKTKGRVKSSRLKKSGVTRKQSHSSSRTKRAQGRKDSK